MKVVREMGLLYELQRGGNGRDEPRRNVSWKETKVK